MAEAVVRFVETILHVKFIKTIMHDMNNGEEDTRGSGNDKREMLKVLEKYAKWSRGGQC